MGNLVLDTGFEGYRTNYAFEMILERRRKSREIGRRIVFTAKSQRSQRVTFLLFSGDRPKNNNHKPNGAQNRTKKLSSLRYSYLST